jgi:hypothetical protein
MGAHAMSGALPPGFTLDEPPAAPSAALPPGFSLDTAPTDAIPGPRGPRPEDTAAGRLIMRNPNLRAVVEAGAAEVPFPQGTGRGNDLLPIVNQGAIAGTLGLPVDMVNSVLRMAGVPVSDRPIGGSASIEAGMARAGQAANTPMVPEVGFTPQTPQQYMARGVGQALGMLNPTILAGRLAAAVGGPVASRVGQTIAQAPVRSPIMVPATEVAAGAGGGFGRAIAEQNYPGNEPVAMLGELAGGVTGGVVAQAPSLLARTPGVATAIDAAKSVLPSGARGRAAERISSLVEDPYAASRAAVAPTISDLTPAQRTGEAGLLELERAVAAENPAIARQLRERAEAAQATLLAEARTLGGRPEDTRAFLEDRVTRLTTALNTRVEQAQTEANRRIAALEPGAPAADASRIVREEFDRAFTAARAQENALWQRAMRHRARPARGGSEGREIHMRGDIHLTGCAERINRLACAHGLQAITKTAFRWSVINQQSRAAMAGKPRTEPCREAKCCFIHFAQGAFGRVFRQGDIAWHFQKCTSSDKAFIPSGASAYELANG